MKKSFKGKPKTAAKTPPVKQTGGVLDRIFGGKAPQSAQQSYPTAKCTETEYAA
jgi:hypothetical protein